MTFTLTKVRLTYGEGMTNELVKTLPANCQPYYDNPVGGQKLSQGFAPLLPPFSIIIL